jgi:transposase-like protein
MSATIDFEALIKESVQPVQQDATECNTSGENGESAPVDLNERKRIAIELIASGASYNKTARKIGVDRITIFRWRQDPEFQARLEQRMQELWQVENLRLKSLIVPALEIVAQHLEDDYDKARWKAANLVLRLARFPKTLEQTEEA